MERKIARELLCLKGGRMEGSAGDRISKEVGAQNAAFSRKKLGEIFVDKGILTPTGVERVVALSRKVGKRFGAVLEDLGFVTGDELAEALAAQYRVKVIKEFHRFRFDQSLLEIVPVDAAVEHALFPLKVEKGNFAVAMADPSDTRIITNIARNNSLTVIPFVATRADIHKAITVHYLKLELGHAGKKRILLVEDDQLIRKSLSATLQRDGYEVTIAEDGMEAFKLVVAVKPDVVITDKEMPRLNGYAFFDSVRKFPEMARTPFILISSTATAEEEEAAFLKGFFDFVPKPVKDATLLVKVRRAIASGSLLPPSH